MVKLTKDAVQVVHSFLPSTDLNYLEHWLGEIFANRVDLDCIDLCADIGLKVRRDGSENIPWRIETWRVGWWVITDHLLTPVAIPTAQAWQEGRRIGWWIANGQTTHELAWKAIQDFHLWDGRFRAIGYTVPPLRVTQPDGMFPTPTLAALQEAADFRYIQTTLHRYWSIKRKRVVKRVPKYRQPSFYWKRTSFGHVWE